MTVGAQMEQSHSDVHATAPARLATRLAFFAAGLSMACCAPLFPFFKDNVGADKATFGIVLLCLGLGSLIAMPITGLIAARYGARRLILLGGYGLVVMLPLMALAHTPIMLGIALFAFGAALGTIDVAMNLHGAEVEGMEQRPLMSNFHAFWSIGGFCGAGLVTLLLWSSASVLICAFAGAVFALMAMFVAHTRCLNVSGKDPEPFALPRGIVLLLSVLTAITFLVEGAVLDWGALLILERDIATAETAGTGFIVFSIAMLVGRLTGDRMVARFGPVAILLTGGTVAILGIALILSTNALPLALTGFLLIGFGAANLVPVLFSAAGRQRIMPPGIAIATVTTTGYAGLLIGPAFIGFVSEASSLSIAFAMVAILAVAVPATAFKVGRA